jgi:serine/threonine-protein kinase
MAQVLEAMAQGMDGFERRVAIKRMLPQDAGDQERRRMFLEEGRIGSRLHHGGIVQIFDYGVIDGAEFLAMEFVDGMDSLRAITRPDDGYTMPEGGALHIAAEVAHALEYLHQLRDEQGSSLAIVHRDVSPQNILLSWDGDVKLSDFGIALSRKRQDRTAVGVVKGKVRYMAPEQALGQRVTGAADVYALGVTLDALLGGEGGAPAMTEDDAAVRAGAARARGVSDGTADLIEACTALDPHARPTATEVAARAGALASQRLGRDGRGALRDWLRTLRSSEQKRSALDDLMGLCLVPVGPEAGRTFVVSRTVVEAKPAEAPPVKRDGGWVLRWSVVMALVVGTAGLLRWGTSSSTAQSFPPALPIDLGASSESSMMPVGLRMASRSSETDRPVHARQLVNNAGRPPILPATARRRSNLKTPSPVPARGLATSGWIHIGGPTLAGGRVTVDGNVSGFVPLELTLPVGRHTIVVSSPSTGQALVNRTVRLGDHHTRAQPLRLLR